MEFTDELKKTLADSSTRDGAKGKIKDAGIILTDDELDSIAGGVNKEQGTVTNPIPMPGYRPFY
ncbi:MAG: hypothetical protein II610_02635 [Treponema sp.]|nr:hypothetical protein [Treponema sp.]